MMLKSLVGAFFNGYIKNKSKQKAYFHWLLDNGDAHLRYDYDLDKNSVVFDLGGYLGEFSEKIGRMYGSQVYMFEPIAKFYTLAKNNLQILPQVKTFQLGLGKENKTDTFFLSDNATSAFVGQQTDKEEVKIVNVIDFMKEHKIEKVDLIKINIEGGEFDILEYLIDQNYISRFVNIQVQFHDFVPDASARRELIRQKLAKTHACTYEYDFIWENWKLK
ncbi:MAG: FkbM family methyltransferase [Bdellovibrionota bacterium]